MDIKAKYESLDMAALRSNDAEIANEIELIREKTGNFSKVSDAAVKNFKMLYDMAKDYPGVVGKEKKQEKAAESIPTIPTMKVVKEETEESKEHPTGDETGEPEKKIKEIKKVDLPEGVDTVKELIKAVENCEEFLKVNRPKVRAYRTDIKKPVRRSEADVYAGKVTGLFKTLATKVEDENKLQKLKSATQEYINKVRTIMGYGAQSVIKKIEAIASQAEKRIEKAA